MFYEIIVSDYYGMDSFPLGLYYRKQKNAYDKCNELNKSLKSNMYFVRSIVFQDDIKEQDNSNIVMFTKQENT